MYHVQMSNISIVSALYQHCHIVATWIVKSWHADSQCFTDSSQTLIAPTLKYPPNLPKHNFTWKIVENFAKLVGFADRAKAS